MNIEEKRKKLNEYKNIMQGTKQLKEANELNKKINNTKVKKLVKKENGFANIMIPIIITTFIIGVAVGIAIVIYYR